MAITLSQLQDYVDANIKQNGRNAITGNVMNYALKNTLDLLNGKQDALVSGTNIKTINSVSLLGSGNISITASAAGSDKQLQFNDGGAFGGNSNLLFDKTTGNLGIGLAGGTPAARIEVKGALGTSASILQKWTSSGAAQIGKVTGDGAFTFGTYTNPNTKLSIDNGASIGAYIGGLKGVISVGNAAGTAYGIDALGRSTTTGGTSYGVNGIADGGGATGINYALRGTAVGSGTNYAGYFDSLGGTTNYALYVQRGDILFGTATTNKIAFWNATPVVQQILATGASHTVDDVITLLQTYGICRQS